MAQHQVSHVPVEEGWASGSWSPFDITTVEGMKEQLADLAWKKHFVPNQLLQVLTLTYWPGNYTDKAGRWWCDGPDKPDKPYICAWPSWGSTLKHWHVPKSSLGTVIKKSGYTRQLLYSTIPQDTLGGQLDRRHLALTLPLHQIHVILWVVKSKE